MCCSAGALRRSQRESSRPATSTLPNRSLRPDESAIENDHQRRFAIRMNRAASVSVAGRRTVATWQPSSIIARRVRAAVAGAATGLPNATMTGYGTRTGSFQKNLPPL